MADIIFDQRKLTVMEQDVTSWGLEYIWTYPDEVYVADADHLPAYPILDIINNEAPDHHDLEPREIEELKELSDKCDQYIADVFEFVRTSTFDNAEAVLFNIFNQDPDHWLEFDPQDSMDMEEIANIIEQKGYYDILHFLVMEEMNLTEQEERSIGDAIKEDVEEYGKDYIMEAFMSWSVAVETEYNLQQIIDDIDADMAEMEESEELEYEFL